MLPIYIQKTIIELLCNQEKRRYKSRYTSFDYSWAKHYALVSKHFFKITKDLIAFHSFIDIGYFKKNNPYKELCLITKESIQNINIQFSLISIELVESLNCDFKSLKSINILYYGDAWLGKSVFLLNHLNKLNSKDTVIVNFDLTINCYLQIYEEKRKEFDLSSIDLSFTFNTHRIDLNYGTERSRAYNFLYTLIKGLNPKSIRFQASSDTTHLRLFHSLSKLNHRFEKITLSNDFIPLYAFYRFLQSPNLTSFKFSIQSHFISDLYEKIQENNSNFNFDEMDNHSFDYESKMLAFYPPACFKNNTNEDEHFYCSFDCSRAYDFRIPIYSLSLWKECLELLKNHKTIKNLDIEHMVCGYQCTFQEKNEKTLNQHMVYDLLDALANNQSIKSLKLWLDIQDSHDFLLSLSQNNKTMRFIKINKNEFSRSNKAQ
ncbi:hypothetical protein CYY_009901 [Polysphondylium violaceum]|uniref:Uncharacterized protein n=1 Tax=Polysphondylium violaceum TaxID=133409 RepID=A0A8J4PKX1_9MYCE|nr:hypothetical protein CYY_009901 [Polysphondylium violaceum]